MNVTLDHIEALTPRATTFWFKPEHPTTYIAGQYIELYLPHNPVDNRGEKRWFTLSSSPTESLLSITTKHVGEPLSSFKQKLFSLQPGAVLKLSEPMGDFVLPKDVSIPLIFVVGGIGVTPVRSMLKWLLDTHEKRQIHIIYAVNQVEDAVFSDLFKAYGATVELIVHDTSARSLVESHKLTSDYIYTVSKKYDQPLIYISGPEVMTEQLEAGLKQLGIAGEQLVLDFFPGYPEGS